MLLIWLLAFHADAFGWRCVYHARLESLEFRSFAAKVGGVACYLLLYRKILVLCFLGRLATTYTVSRTLGPLGPG